MTTIYALVDPRDGRTRYVGKTTGALRTRLRAHVNDVKRGNMYAPRHRWLRGLVEAGLEPAIITLEVVPESGDWQSAEQRWIAQCDTSENHLLNATAGGDGLQAYRHTEKTKRKQSEAAKRRSPETIERVRLAANAGRARPEVRDAARRRGRSYPPERIECLRVEWTEERKRKVSDALKGRQFSPEWRQKISLARKGRPRSTASRLKQSETMRRNARLRKQTETTS